MELADLRELTERVLGLTPGSFFAGELACTGGWAIRFTGQTIPDFLKSNAKLGVFVVKEGNQISIEAEGPEQICSFLKNLKS